MHKWTSELTENLEMHTSKLVLCDSTKLNPKNSVFVNQDLQKYFG